MAELPSDPLPEEQAELSICIFPHLAEFLVIDARKENPQGPSLFQFTSEQVLDERFYKETESDFSQLLRQRDQPISYLIGIPQQLEETLKRKALEAILSALDGGAVTRLPNQLAVLICAGDILNMPVSQIAQVFEQLSGGEADPPLISQWTDEFEKLQARERQAVKDRLEERSRLAVKPMHGEFYTLWQNPG